MTKGNPLLFVCGSYSAQPSRVLTMQLEDDLRLLCFVG